MSLCKCNLFMYISYCIHPHIQHVVHFMPMLVQARSKLSKSGTANIRHKNLVYSKEVGCHMNMKANAEHTAYYYAAANIEVCQKGYDIVHYHLANVTMVFPICYTLYTIRFNVILIGVV